MSPEYNIRAVERALAVLDCFDVKHTSFSLVEISREIQLSASTTLRLLSTLENKHYLYRNPENNRYYLGARLAQLGSAIFTNLDICQEAQPILHELLEKYNESVGIYERNGDVRICIARLNSTQPLRSVLTVGSTNPLTRGAAGRILLAYVSPKDQLRLLEEDSYTTLEALEKIKSDGYTISQGERDPSVESIAAPIFDANGQVHHAIFITGPAGRFAMHEKEELIDSIRQAAVQLSIRMGYRP